MNHIERLLEKYPDDKDILKLLSEKSRLHADIQSMGLELKAVKEQLAGLHRYVQGRKLMEKLDDQT